MPSLLSRRSLLHVAMATALTPLIGLSAGAETFGDAELVERVESLYNDIFLYKRKDGRYILSFGAKRLRYIESIVNPADPTELPVYYTQSMTVAYAYPQKLERAAVIGLGGGRTAWYGHKMVPAMSMTGVDLDPSVIEIGKTYFGLKDEENFAIVEKDGRLFLNTSPGNYDVIFVDAYRGPFVPFHLLTKEFFELAKKKLAPGGVVAQNVEPTTMLFDAAVATIGSVFPNVDFYEGAGNIVVIAYDGPRKTPEELAKLAGERDATLKFRYPLADLLARRFEPAWDGKTGALTDDFAPVEYLKAVERHNAKGQ